MRHHLRKAKEIYSSEGIFRTTKSALRYIPIELNNFAFRLRWGDGVRVMEEDWDNLFILDGCRYDMLEKSDLLPEGTLDARISLGSSSEEFLERNFTNGEYHDTVYVNANPFIPRLGLDKGTFHAVVDCLGQWDAELQTVPPDKVAEAAKRAVDQFPNKRLIIHFMQPHTPFIGEQGRDLGGGWTMDKKVEEKDKGVWDKLRDQSKDINIETVWAAYEENLRIVLDEVKPLVEAWDGKSVITADHGNLVGERLSPIPTTRKFGHPYGVYTEELVKVPWFVFNSNERRTITEDPPLNIEGIPQEDVEDRLEALGYK